MCDDSWRDLAPPWEGKASLHLVAKS
jgi:hypothetical protein